MKWQGCSPSVNYRLRAPRSRWVYHGWQVTVAYVIGFFVLLAVLGWQPTPKRGDPPGAPPAVQEPAPPP